MKDQFAGLPGEDAATHLNSFVDLCDMQKKKDVDKAALISQDSTLVRGAIGVLRKSLLFVLEKSHNFVLS